MIYKREYTDFEDRIVILAEYSDKYLIEEQNITEGNFLIFSDEPMPERIIYTEVPKEDFESLIQENEMISECMLDVDFRLIMIELGL